ncbi:hypothetical protein BH23GEM9_BH23GEM9_18650 [soil metagenome]
MPFNIGPVEMIFVMAILLILFGAKRLPELGSGLGKGIREFKRSIRDIGEEARRDDTPNQIHDASSRPQVPAPTASTEARVQEKESVRRDS